MIYIYVGSYALMQVAGIIVGISSSSCDCISRVVEASYLSCPPCIIKKVIIIYHPSVRLLFTITIIKR